ncbi:hypothetical protein B0H14DRAFT_2610534 [Mycena olivaceomarginata]|nr:hypothetical protein B0H14DRAFT_2610534 [Mycena olivaceomarginata]
MGRGVCLSSQSARIIGPRHVSGSKGKGVCFPLIAGKAFETGECNNVNVVQSLVFANLMMNASASSMLTLSQQTNFALTRCLKRSNPDCEVGDSVAREFFNLNSDNRPVSRASTAVKRAFMPPVHYSPEIRTMQDQQESRYSTIERIDDGRWKVCREARKSAKKRVHTGTTP